MRPPFGSVDRARVTLASSRTMTDDSTSAFVFGAVGKTATSHLRHAHVEKRWRDRVGGGEDIATITPLPGLSPATNLF